MNRNRLVSAAAAAAALLITGGVAYAVSTDDGDNRPRSSVTADDSPSATPDDTPSATPDDTPSALPSPDDSPTSAPAAPSGDEMGSGEAEEIALAHVGGGTVTEVEREWEHGRLEWKVEIHRDGVEHDVRVDALSGDITRVDVDDDRDDDDKHDDDRDDNSGHGSDDDHHDDHDDD
ncbi:PepSY domain-containing protein [Jiangella anatolica]|uniref:PepSY domain-containing protein n=1 Tax=Jiangella anatolica TaxID=2670374 RepID=A0A2W2B3R0_9ACTN|nr:PepSY domain-containing protein [Jiangella anatolica]PZF81985.1 hypothetical protein C1I92_18830 [Jiangella anatolica]